MSQGRRSYGFQEIASIPPGWRLPSDRQEVAMHVEAHHTADELAAASGPRPGPRSGGGSPPSASPSSATAPRTSPPTSSSRPAGPDLGHPVQRRRPGRAWPTRPAGVGSRRSTRPPRTRMAERSGPGRPRPTGSAPSAGRMSASSSEKEFGLVRSCPSGLPPPPRASGSSPSGRRPAPPEGAKPRPRTLFQKSSPSRVAEVVASPPRRAGRGLVRGRGPVRPEGHTPPPAASLSAAGVDHGGDLGKQVRQHRPDVLIRDGPDGSGSGAGERPFWRPVTALRAWYVATGTSSSATAHLNTRTTLRPAG